MSENAQATLYVIPGSHACRTAMLALEHKAIPYRTVELVPGLHPFAVRLRRFPGGETHRRAGEGRQRMLATMDRTGTVPSLDIDGTRVQTNMKIARHLEERRPDPPLFPADPELRRQAEDAERWGDDVLQMVARRLVLAGALHGRDGLTNGGADGRLGVLLYHNDRVRLASAKVIARLVFNVDAEAERELLAELPAQLDRVDAWIEAGVLDGARLNAADYMIVTSLALLLYRRDLQEEILARPAGRLADRVLPEPAAVAA